MNKIEIYSKSWCPYCNKAKALLESRGLSYEEIDTTHDETRERDMVERSRRQTVPQIFIDDLSIGGYDDLARINATGKLDRMLGISVKAELQQVYDVVVVGGGPAGLSAALYAARKNLSVAVVSLDIGGQLGTTAEVENYPGIASVTGPALVAQFEEHADRYGITKLIGEQVTGLTVKDRCRIVTTASGKDIHGRTAILARGEIHVDRELETGVRGVFAAGDVNDGRDKQVIIAAAEGAKAALAAFNYLVHQV